MANSNKRNIHYFEAESMLGLYEALDEWQVTNEKRLLSINVQSDADKFCCIALTNPSEVVIVARDGHGRGTGYGEVNRSGNALRTS